MISIYLTEWDFPGARSLAARRLDRFPEFIRSRYTRFLRPERAYSFLIGQAVLLYGLYDLKIPFDGGAFVRDEYGRPSIRECGNPSIGKYGKPSNGEHGGPSIGGEVDFNISHSGQMVACAIGKGSRVGIDIEKVDERRHLLNFEGYFFEEEWERIMSSEDVYGAFYEYWTKKEAALKADGRGLSVSLKRVRVSGERVSIDGECFCCRPFDVAAGYRGHIASARPFAEAVVVPVDFSRLMDELSRPSGDVGGPAGELSRLSDDISRPLKIYNDPGR